MFSSALQLRLNCPLCGRDTKELHEGFPPLVAYYEVQKRRWGPATPPKLDAIIVVVTSRQQNTEGLDYHSRYCARQSGVLVRTL